MKRWHIKDENLNHEKVWGSECWMVNNEEYCGKLLFLKKNHKCSMHYHKLKHETFIVTKGVILMELDGEVFIMSEGDAVEVDRGMKHSFTGITDATILEVSTQHYDDDSFRDDKSKKLGWKDRRLLKKLVRWLGEKTK